MVGEQIDPTPNSVLLQAGFEPVPDEVITAVQDFQEKSYESLLWLLAQEEVLRAIAGKRGVLNQIRQTPTFRAIEKDFTAAYAKEKGLDPNAKTTQIEIFDILGKLELAAHEVLNIPFNKQHQGAP